MSKILPVIFVLILGMVGVGLDYYLYLQKEKALAAMDTPSMGGYVDYVAQRLSAANESAGMSDMDLAVFLPAAPTGWERRPFEVPDAEALSGRPYIKTDLALDTTNDMISGLRTTRISRKHIVDTFISGDTRIIVEVTFAPAAAMNGFLGKLTSEIKSAIESEVDFNENRYAFVKGVSFVDNGQTSIDHQTDIRTPVEYRSFGARLGQQASFLIMTNATDAEVMAIIGQIDVVGLNAMLQNPVASVHADKPVLFGDKLAALTEAEGAALEEAVAAPVEEEAADSEAAKPATKGTAPKLISKGCVRRAGKLDCPKE